MPITAECPICGHKGPVPDTFKGKKVQCHECHNMFTISAPAGARPGAKQKSNPNMNGSGMNLAGTNGVSPGDATPNPFDFDGSASAPQPTGKSGQGTAKKPAAKPAPTGKSAQGRPRPVNKKKNLDPLPMGALILGGIATVMGVAAIVVASKGLVGLASVPVGGFGLLLAIGGVCTSLRSGWPVLVPILGLLVCLGALPVGGYHTYKLIASGALASSDEHAKKGDADTTRKPETTAANPNPEHTPPIQPRPIEAPPPSPPDQYVDARQGFRVGKAWVKVSGVDVDVLRGKDGREVSKDNRLLVRLTIQNVGTNEFDYFSWATSKPRGDDPLPLLADSEGAAVKWAQPDGVVLVNQVVSAVPVPAGQSVYDVLAFDLPADNINSLKLELPAANIGEAGKLKLQMPKVMLDAIVKGIRPENPGDGPPKKGDPRMAMFVQEQLAVLQKAKNEAEKETAITFLGNCGKDGAPAAMELGRLLKNNQPGRVRAAAAEALGKIGPAARDTIPDLRGALKDEFWKVKANAAKALGNMGPDAKVAIPDLLPLLASRDEEVPGNAKAAIQKLDPSKLPK